MNERSNPDPREDARDLLGAYALGALSDDEREAVEEHLLEHQDARTELHALQLGAAWLARSAERPAASTWDAIASEMARDLAEDAASRDEVVVPMRRPAGSTRRLFAVAAALVAVLAVAGAVRSALVTPGDMGDAALTRAYVTAKTTPGARAVALETKHGRVALDAVVLEDGSGIVVPRALEPLDEQRTYQLWALTDTGPVSLGTLGATPGAHAFRIARGASSLALTKEPAGGSSRPTGVPVATAALTA